MVLTISRWAAAVSEGEAPAEWFHSEVRRLYGFDVAGVDYAAPTETDQEWPG
jgi:enoyl-[acyl-carrier protein] reductase / trans-2-enoyl-CoA reductase (NAD+)